MPIKKSLRSPSSISEDLLRHQALVHSVAKSLLDDDSRAWDVVQKTWIRVLQSPPKSSDSLRGWLATITRNIARSEIRSESRRAIYEDRYLSPRQTELEPASRDREVRNALIDALREIREPYRSAILLRYYLELTPFEIAARLDLPQGTVRSHLSRGLRLLRKKLREKELRPARIWPVLLVSPATVVSVPAEASAQTESKSILGPVIRWGVSAFVAMTVLVTVVLLLQRLDPMDGEAFDEFPSMVTAIPIEEVEEFEIAEPSYRGRISAVASEGLEVSPPVPTGFEVQGTVLGEIDTLDPDFLELLHVDVSIPADNGFRILASCPLEEGGAWGPVTVPFEPESRYEISLQGPALRATPVVISSPRPGESRAIDLVASTADAWFHVVNQNREDLPLTLITAEWEEAGSIRSVTALPSHDGFKKLVGLGSPLKRTTFSCAGYATRTYNDVNPDPKKWQVVTLLPARTLRGSVSCRGEPAETFSVVYWPVDQPWEFRSTEFPNAPGGNFVLSDVPPGPMVVMAYDSDQQMSDPRTVRVGSESLEKSMELLESRWIEGRVVDGLANDPIESASIWADLGIGDSWRHRIGPAVRSGGDGEFRVRAAHGLAVVEVSARSYGRHLAPVGPSKDLVDLGSISLSCVQPLEILLLPESPVDFSKCFVWSSSIVGRTAFPADGRLVVPEFSPGIHNFTLDLDDCVERFVQLRLRPGSPWSLEYRFDPERTLHLEILKPDMERMPRGFVVLRDRNAVQESVVRHILTNDGPIEIPGAPESFSLEVFLGRTLLASHHGMFEGGHELALRIPLEKATRFVRVVDVKGVRVPGATVVFQDSEDLSLYFRLQTDHRGQCAMPSVPSGKVYASISHPVHGQRFGVELEIAQMGRRHQIELRAEQTVEAQVLSGGLPIDAVLCSLRCPKTQRVLRTTVSDEDGRLSWSKIAEGSYELEILDPNYWSPPTTLDTRDAFSRVVEVRRRGDLEFIAAPRAGFPPDVRLRLTSVDPLLPDIPEHVLEGTDKFLIEGLPQGPYTWQMESSRDAVLLEGTVVIVPEQVTTRTIPVPIAGGR